MYKKKKKGMNGVNGREDALNGREREITKKERKGKIYDDERMDFFSWDIHNIYSNLQLNLCEYEKIIMNEWMKKCTIFLEKKKLIMYV